MTEQSKTRKAAGIIILLALIAFLLWWYRSRIRSAFKSKTAPLPPFVDPALTGLAPAVSAAQGRWQYMERTAIAAAGTLGYVFTDPDVGPLTGEAYIVHYIAYRNTDGNAQAMTCRLVGPAADIKNASFSANFSRDVVTPEMITIAPRYGAPGNTGDGLGTQNNGAGGTLQTSAGVLLINGPIIVPPKWSLVIFENNGTASGAQRYLVLRILYEVIRSTDYQVGGTLIQPGAPPPEAQKEPTKHFQWIAKYLR